MHVLDPEILSDVSTLSAPLLAAGIGAGALLYLFGWRLHRFWLVLAASVTAGLVGLNKGPEYGTQPLVAALLLALTAGVLAVAVMRGLAFAAGAMAAYLALRAMAPGWEQPWVCVVVGGLLGVVLFRLWVMALTSMAGTVLLLYAGVGLAHSWHLLDAVAWAEKRGPLINLGCAVATLVGVAAQIVIERKVAQVKKERKKREEEETRLAKERVRHLAKKRWFGVRRAG
jgi:hypothetical protein